MTNFEGCGGYEVGNGVNGVLLLHGFTGTPKDMTYVAEHLAHRGFRVSVPLLPGHANDPEVLKKTGWGDWIAVVETGWQALTASCPVSCICGLSMGALLALHIAAHWRNVKAVACLSTPLILRGWWRKVSVPLLRFSPWKDLYYTKKGGSDVRDERAKAEFPGYSRVPVAGILNFSALVDHVRADLPRVTSPLLLIHSRNDHTASLKNVTVVEKHVSSRLVDKIILDDSFHVVTIDVDSTRVSQAIGDFFLRHTGGSFHG